MAALVPACGAAVTGLRVQIEFPVGGVGDARQFVVRVLDRDGLLIHECLAPGTPAPEPFASGQTWTVLFDDERAGDVSVEVLAIGAAGDQTMRGTVDYYMGPGTVARPVVLMSPNLTAVTLPAPCTPAPRESLPSGTPRGSIVTVDERGTFVPPPDSGA